MPATPFPEPASPFGGAGPGTRLGPLEVTVSGAANERYWRAASVDHPELADGALYPPIAANLTILVFQTVAPRPLLHTAHRLRCLRRADAGTPLRVTGLVTDRFHKRGRAYAEVEATVAAAADGEPIWWSQATFTELAGP